MGSTSQFVRQILIVPGDASATVNNIMANESLFRLGFVADLIFLTVWLLLPLALYKLLKPVNNIHAVLMILFALVMVPIMFINNVFQFAALLLLSGADYLTVFETGQLHAQVMFFLDLRNTGFLMAYIFYGLWLFPFGYLVYKSGYIPKILGVLLMIGCFGYLIDFFTIFLLPDFDVEVSLFTGIGELLIPFWLLFFGGKLPEMKS
ncbi:DUF4386 domain-containing protein [Chloroflexota bacterium]